MKDRSLCLGQELISLSWIAEAKIEWQVAKHVLTAKRKKPSNTFSWTVMHMHNEIRANYTFVAKPHNKDTDEIMGTLLLLNNYQCKTPFGRWRSGSEQIGLNVFIVARTLVRISPFCVKRTASDLLTTHQVSAQSVQLFLRYGKGVRTCTYTPPL